MIKQIEQVVGFPVSEEILEKAKNNFTRVFQETLCKISIDHLCTSILLQKFKRIVSFTEVPIAGVSLDFCPNLHINPLSFTYSYNQETKEYEETTLKWRVGVILHECEHISRLHLVRFKEQGNNFKLGNYAADFSINTRLLDKLQDNKNFRGLYHTDFGWKGDMSYEYYYERLKELQDKNKKGKNGESGQENSGKGSSQGLEGMENPQSEGHKVWNGKSGLSNEEKKNTLKKILQDTVDEYENVYKGKLAGTSSAHYLESIEKLSSRQVSWRTETRIFTKSVNQKRGKKSWTKRNRRFPFRKPGTKRLKTARIACIIDTSGSMSNKALSVIMGELESLHRRGVVIEIIQADTEVKSHDTLKLGGRLKDKLTIEGRGGTAYDAPIKYAKGLNPDGIIYFGDMDCWDKPENPQIPFLWVSVRGTERPGPFGKMIKIDESEMK